MYIFALPSSFINWRILKYVKCKLSTIITLTNTYTRSHDQKRRWRKEGLCLSPHNGMTREENERNCLASCYWDELLNRWAFNFIQVYVCVSKETSAKFDTPADKCLTHIKLSSVWAWHVHHQGQYFSHRTLKKNKFFFLYERKIRFEEKHNVRTWKFLDRSVISGNICSYIFFFFFYFFWHYQIQRLYCFAEYLFMCLSNLIIDRYQLINFQYFSYQW